MSTRRRSSSANYYSSSIMNLMKTQLTQSVIVSFRRSTPTRITPSLALRPPTSINPMMNIMDKNKKNASQLTIAENLLQSQRSRTFKCSFFVCVSLYKMENFPASRWKTIRASDSPSFYLLVCVRVLFWSEMYIKAPWGDKGGVKLSLRRWRTAEERRKANEWEERLDEIWQRGQDGRRVTSSHRGLQFAGSFVPP